MDEVMRFAATSANENQRKFIQAMEAVPDLTQRLAKIEELVSKLVVLHEESCELLRQLAQDRHR